MKNNNQKNTHIAISIVALALVFIVAMVTFRICGIGDLPAQFTGALLGSVITCIITLLLLQGQSSTEELKERNMTIFERKQEVYHKFLEKLQQIVQDGQIAIYSKDENGNVDRTIDELKELIFQIGYLQLHTSKETIEQVLKNLTNMIGALNDFDATDNAEKQKTMAEFYSSFSDSLFRIVSILKKDLYNTDDSEPIKKEEMQKVLLQCNLYVETEDLNPKDLQCLFWDKLQDKMIEKGYNLEKYDFKSDVEKYYARARNRHRWYGVEVPVETADGKKHCFSVEIENTYYYGFKRPEENAQDEKTSNVLSAMNTQPSAWWFGWKFPSGDLCLDFWRMNSPAFDQLKDPRKQEAFIGKIADEMDGFIKRFIQKYDNQ